MSTELNRQLLTAKLVDQHTEGKMNPHTGNPDVLKPDELRLMTLLAVPYLGHDFNFHLATSLKINDEVERIKQANASTNITANNGQLNAIWRMVEYPNGIDLSIIMGEVVRPPAPIIVPERRVERIATLAFKAEDKPKDGLVFAKNVDRTNSRLFKRAYFVDTEQVVELLEVLVEAVKQTKQ